jgi:hypothetical protein
MEIRKQVTALLEKQWTPIEASLRPKAVLSPSAPPPGPGDTTYWRMMVTPQFPAEFPAKSGTLLVCYGFAYGTNFTRLRDGAYVLSPWAKVATNPSAGASRVELLGPPKQLGIQGVRPLRKEETEILQTPDVERHLLEPHPPAAVKAYYRLWIANNAVLAGALQSAHKSFFDWASK